MIISKICGGLGNEFFRYAYTRKVLCDRGDSEKLILKFSGSSSFNHSGGNELKNFNTVDFEVTTNNILMYGSIKQKLLYLVYGIDRKIFSLLFGKIEAEKRKDWWYNFMRSKGIIFCDHTQNNTVIRTPNTPNVMISGNFENKLFFNDIKDILREELTPKYPLIERNLQLYDTIIRNNSVCVHFRRGDYVDDERYRKTHYLCDEKYIMKAINEMRKRVDSPVFIFFSNDIDWVRKNLNISDAPCYYESGKDPVWETFRLMSSCKNFVMSNSTLSWWAQYLCKNENKIVVSPSRWYNASIQSFLIEDSFITIDV